MDRPRPGVEFRILKIPLGKVEPQDAEKSVQSTSRGQRGSLKHGEKSQLVRVGTDFASACQDRVRTGPDVCWMPRHIRRAQTEATGE